LKEKSSEKLRNKAKMIHVLDILMRFYRMRTVQSDVDALASKMYTYPGIV
jgi:hypothetical protein